MMKRRNVVRTVFLLLLCMLGCLALFGCDKDEKPAPEVKNVSVTADAGYGKAGYVHRLGYDVPEGCEVSVSVQKGGKPATAADFACRDGGYVFFRAGEYTLTVYAAKDGMQGSSSQTVSIAVAEAFVDGVTLSPLDAYGGKVGGKYLISYTVAEGSLTEVSFTMGDEDAEVIYDPALRTAVFPEEGEYTVTVSSKLGGTEASGTAAVTIAPPDAPELSFSSNRTSIREEETLTLTHTAVYPIVDSAAKEEVIVRYRRGTSGNFSDADEDLYTLNGDLFTPHTTGDWRLVYRVESKWGATAEKEISLRSTAAAMTLSALGGQRYRVQTGVPFEAAYVAGGAVEKYNVTFDTNGNDSVKVERGQGSSVVVTAYAAEDFTVTVTYTHKTSSSSKQTLDLDFYAVEDLAFAPVWGEDPFGGMPAEVLTDLGHLLYFDAASCGGEARTFTGKDVTYRISEQNLSDGGAQVQILYAANDRSMPYLFVENGGSGNASGSFTLRMTLTDPATGYSATATKKFTVTAGSGAAQVSAFVEKNRSFFELGSLGLGSMGRDAKKNAILTKNGIIIRRDNADGGLAEGTFGRADLASAKDACSLQFEMRVLGVNASGAAQIGIGLETGSKDSMAGFVEIGMADGRIAVTHTLSGVREFRAEEMPELALGERISVRLECSKSGDAAMYILYVQTKTANVECLRLICTATSKASSAGAPIAGFRFDHRGFGGCSMVENVLLHA